MVPPSPVIASLSWMPCRIALLLRESSRARRFLRVSRASPRVSVNLHHVLVASSTVLAPTKLEKTRSRRYVPMRRHASLLPFHHSRKLCLRKEVFRLHSEAWLITLPKYRIRLNEGRHDCEDTYWRGCGSDNERFGLCGGPARASAGLCAAGPDPHLDRLLYWSERWLWRGRLVKCDYRKSLTGSL